MMITLVGHGYVGNAIASRLRQEGVSFAWMRHINRFKAFGPIINAAGYIGFPNVEACETHKAETMEGNVFWPLQCEAMSEGFPVIHISSGCVYTGFKEGGYLETDKPNFSFDNGSFYSGSKVVQQLALAKHLSKSYLLRMRMPFGLEDHPKNLLTKFRNYPKLMDGENSLSRIEDVAKVAVYFARNLPEPGIYNLANPGGITTREITEIMGVEKDWFTEQEFKAFAKTPRSFCVLNTDKLQAVCPIDDVRTALKMCVTETPAELAVA